MSHKTKVFRLALFCLFLFTLTGERVQAEWCFEDCMHTIGVNFEISGEGHCCLPTGALKDGPCSPLDIGGYECPSYVIRYLADSGCLAATPIEGVGMNCYDVSIPVAYKQLIGCLPEIHGCVYATEVVDFVGGSTCWECPSEGPPQD